MEGETAEGMDIVSSRKEADQLDGEESYRSLFCFGSLEKNEAFKMALAKKPTTTSATCSNSSLDLRVWLLERRAGARIGPRQGTSNTGCSVQQCNDHAANKVLPYSTPVGPASDESFCDVKLTLKAT